jgi:FdhE protein
MKLQEAFIEEQKNWKTKFSTLKISHNNNFGNPQLPIIHQINWQADETEIFACVKAMLDLLKSHTPQFESAIEKVDSILTEELAAEWVKQAIAINEAYFTKLSEDHELESWIPPFVAENAAKPILQLISESEKEQIKENDRNNGCPCCGEPGRMAELDKNKKKKMLCPRCHTSWNLMKLHCAHCGNNDHKLVRIVEVGEDGVEQIQLCNNCHNYTKVISTSRMLKKFDPAMLDLKTIHLDYIAQQQLEIEAEKQTENEIENETELEIENSDVN